MKRLSFMLLIAMSVLFSTSCKKSETVIESKVKTFVENMSFKQIIEGPVGGTRTYSIINTYSANLKTALSEMNIHGGKLVIYVSDSNPDANARIYYPLTENISQDVIDKGDIKISVSYSYQGIVFSGDIANISLRGVVFSVTTVETANVFCKFVITMP